LQLSLCFSPNHQKNPPGILDMVVSGGKQFEFTRNNVLKVELSKRNIAGLLTQIKNILKEIMQHVNN
jgi:hypothetical protein